VKQQKKSSNKWTCVVCNQKQSVWKVFAKGYMARDLRNFVQSFNMSRTFSQQNQSHLPEGPTLQPFDPHRKRPIDWTQYLEPDDHHQNQNILEDEKNGSEFEPKTLSKMAKEMFKKPKLDGGDDDNDQPNFSKRNTISDKYAVSSVKEPKKCVQTMATGASTWSNYLTENGEEPRSRLLTTTKRASKWNDYITHDDDDNHPDNLLLDNTGRGGFTGGISQWSNNVFETISNDDRVKDDIHPDFL
ncbi:hypothetical protein CFOL_v3_22103, partial [Cephalotus follicularis]